MEEILGETFGVMVYQEDVIKVAHLFGKLSLEDADKLRRGMGGKYRERNEFAEVKEKFLTGCRNQGYDEKLITEVWRQMESFGGYAFAKGHSASYAVESYQCMFLKTYYPLEYMVAVINNGGGFYRTEFYVHEARMNGGIIHAPDINKSEYLTTIYGKDIYLGIGLMADLEKNVAEIILNERHERGEFKSITDFLNRVLISVEQLKLFIRIGAFNSTGRNKKELLWDMYAFLGNKKKSEPEKELFERSKKAYTLPQLEHGKYDDAMDETEILGFTLCSPFELIKDKPATTLIAAQLPEYHHKMVSIVGQMVTVKNTRTKHGDGMGFGTFLDREGKFIDTTHFPDTMKKFPFQGKGCYLIKGKVAEEFGFYSIEVTEMQRLDYVTRFDEDKLTEDINQKQNLLLHGQP
jgi:DNA polymerase III alpha subunit